MQIGRLLPSAVLLLLIVIASLEPAASSPHDHNHRRLYRSIFSFGDSFADTGNNPTVWAWNFIFDPVTRPPYGTTFFGRPTGRNCDGRLILDFIAERVGLPYVPPYLGPPFAFPSPADSVGFREGASFAVGSATALDVEFFRERGNPGPGSKFPLFFQEIRDNLGAGSKFPLKNISLSVQMEWFESLKASLCGTTQECRRSLAGSLFIVGEFGVNDYQGKNVPELRSYVPYVIRTITTAIERLIKLGAKTLVVPGVIPLGCLPPVLTLFPDAAPTEYEPRTGCLKSYNELGRYHNALLQVSLKKLRARHPDAVITYADFFTPVMDMVKSPRKFGLRKDVLTVCCGGSGKYNFNFTVPCGDPEATTCSDPSASLYWDGVHFTEAANRYIASSWLRSMNYLNMRGVAAVQREQGHQSA